jgi:hypothetical protein
MEKIKSEYIQLLLAAIIIFAIGVMFILSDLYRKVGAIELYLIHSKDMKKSASCVH